MTDAKDTDLKPTSWFWRFKQIPLVFFGIGFYRAWVELAFIRPTIDIPALQISGRDMFDFALIATYLLLALLSRRMAPLVSQKKLRWASGLLTVIGTALVVSTCFFPEISIYVAIPGTLAGGVGLGFMGLMWCEVYGSLNPVKIALYYSGAFIVGALTVYICNGFNETYTAGAIILLPLLSLACVISSYSKLPEEDRPRKVVAHYSFPWKPILLMAVYAFAFGICESNIYVVAGPHSSIGVVIASAVVFIGSLGWSSKFNFSILYRIALPTMVCGLMVPIFFPSNIIVVDIFVNMSFASFSILIMMILGSLTYRWKMCAVLLFGVEHGLRQLVMMMGRHTHDIVSASGITPLEQSAILGGIVIVAIVTATALLLSERDLSSKWGITFLGADNVEGHQDEAVELNNLADNCLALTREKNLSHRESEVLYLLAEHRSISQIEHELYIANGTVKAHVRHIYEKLGIHSRAELYEMLGVTGDDTDDD